MANRLTVLYWNLFLRAKVSTDEFYYQSETILEENKAEAGLLLSEIEWTVNMKNPEKMEILQEDQESGLEVMAVKLESAKGKSEAAKTK